MTSPESVHTADLAGAAAAVDLAQELVDQACASLRGRGGIDANQVVAYDVSHAAAAVGTARAALQYGEQGKVEAAIAAAFVADVVADLAGKVAGREALWGVEPGWAAPVSSVLGGRARTRRCWPRRRRPKGRGTSARTSSSCGRRSTASLRRRCARTPSTCILHERDPTFPLRRGDRGAGRAGRLRPLGASRSTAASARAARASTWAWSWPPRSSPGARSASAAR